MTHWRDLLDPDAAPGNYLAWPEVRRRTSLSRTTAWRLQRRGDFPAPYAISPGRVGYRAEEIEAWRLSRDPRGSQPPPRRADKTPAPPSARDKAASEPRMTAAPASGRPDADPLRKDAPRRKRRPRGGDAEHAQAIAQQMRFDF